MVLHDEKEQERNKQDKMNKLRTHATLSAGLNSINIVISKPAKTADIVPTVSCNQHIKGYSNMK